MTTHYLKRLVYCETLDSHDYEIAPQIHDGVVDRAKDPEGNVRKYL